MAGFKTFTSATLSSADVNGYLMKQVVIQCTSSTRPTGVEGMTIYETDTDKLLTYTGATWSSIGPVSGALTTWTPTVTQSATPTFTISNAAYTRTGRWIEGYAKLTFTATPGTANNAITIGLPVAAAVTSNFVFGAGNWLDSSASAYYAFFPYITSSTTFQLLQTLASATPFLGVTGSSNGAAVATGDIIMFTFAYEAAADA
jgi:hypothetical protein